MNANELEQWRKERAFRDELEKQCKANGFKLWNVTISDQLIYRDPEPTGFTYDPAKPDTNRNWYDKYIASGKSLEEIQELRYQRA